ncbi:17011_t:CDS:2, partial [Dentiscutata heterogama]
VNERSLFIVNNSSIWIILMEYIMLNELKENFDQLTSIQQIEISKNENIEENNDLQQLSTDLSISQIIDLSLSAFSATNNILFESTTNRLALYERNRNLGNMKYNLISLAQQIVNEENSEISNNSYN